MGAVREAEGVLPMGGLIQLFSKKEKEVDRVLLFDFCLQLIDGESILLHFCSTLVVIGPNAVLRLHIFISHPLLGFLMLSNNNQTSSHHVERTY
jgi:hypothetical protein